MNTSAFTIRRLEPSTDAGLFREVRLEGLRTSPESFGSDFATENTHGLEWFAERLTTSEAFGAFREGALLGVAALGLQAGAKRSHKAVLWGMYVSPSARGSGVGRALVDAVVTRARERAELIQLGVTRTNQAARRLYTAAGFKEYGLEKDALKIGDRYFDEILMALDLRPG